MLQIQLICYNKIRHRQIQGLAATRLRPVEFDALLITFKHHWDEYYSHKRKGGKLEALHNLLYKLFNPLHDRLPVFRDCQSQTNLGNEPNYFPDRRFDFSLLGSLSAATKLPKALFKFTHTLKI